MAVTLMEQIEIESLNFKTNIHAALVCGVLAAMHECCMCLHVE